ncbi:phosphoglycerate kinase [Dehalobacter sp. DCM]|uniref:phosphoglycerate kinase n=1 Tax=Dehalobacter sp. DCM TaxID=2907827 RepID=UPI003081CA45|nr:phosphoglycerate kinase [Dehalobacter sp. DCM]
MDKMGIDEIAVKGERVFVRVDFNVPMDDQQVITDDTRIRAALPTVKHLVDNGARVILASHLGRPKGKVDPRYSLAPVAGHLSQLLQQDVQMAPDCVGTEVKVLADGLRDGQILILENVRYHAEEEKNDPDFARSLADLADIYVNDAFGAAHRAHASTEGIAKYIPAYAGFLMKKELDILGQALSNPNRPFAAIIGGAKVSDKIGVIDNLLKKVDALIIGGGMANTFLKAQGFEVGKSLIEPDKIDLAAELIRQAEQRGVKLMLPADVVVTREFKADAPFRVAEVNAIQADEMALDIGPASAKSFADTVLAAQTVIWNGPMGVFEMDNFARGTEQIAQAMAECTGTTIIGGGDSVAAVEKVGVAEKMTHISTGGGASLEFLEGKTLPGVAILKDKNE